MGMDTITFDDEIVKKKDFYGDDTQLFKIEDIDLDKIVVSVKEDMAKERVI